MGTLSHCIKMKSVAALLVVVVVLGIVLESTADTHKGSFPTGTYKCMKDCYRACPNQQHSRLEKNKHPWKTGALCRARCENQCRHWKDKKRYRDALGLGLLSQHNYSSEM